MAAEPKKAGKGIGGRLTQKVGPLPVYAWAILAIGGYYLYTRYQSSAATAAATTATTPSTTDTTGTTGTATDTSGTTGGGSATGDSSGNGTGSGYSGANDMLAQLLASNETIAADLASLSSSSTLTGNSTSQGVATNDISPGFEPAAVTSNAAGSALPNLPGLVRVTTAGGSTLIGPDAKGSVAGGSNFGGITSVKTLANGAKLTTYGSGRQTEQAPGKSAYVVKA